LLAVLRDQNGVALLEIADNMASRSVAFDAALQELATLLHPHRVGADRAAGDCGRRAGAAAFAGIGANLLRRKKCNCSYQIAIPTGLKSIWHPTSMRFYHDVAGVCLAFAPARGGMSQQAMLTSVAAPQVARANAPSVPGVQRFRSL